MIQQVCIFIISIIKSYMETATNSNNKLLTFLMRMTTTAFSSRYIIYPVNPLYIEWHVFHAFCHCKITTRVNYFRKAQNLANCFFHIRFLLKLRSLYAFTYTLVLSLFPARRYFYNPWHIPLQHVKCAKQ